MPEFEGYVRVGGARLWVETRGEGAPLLMVMGIGGHTRMWEPLLGHLRGFRTVCYDAPGTGRSPAVAASLPMPELAALATGVLDALDVGAAAVLGYSFGGAVAQQMAHQAPGRVSRLVLASTNYGVGSVVGAPAWWMLTPARYWSPAILATIAPFLYGGRQRSRVVAPHFNQAPPDQRSYASQVVAISTWSSVTWLHRLGVPTLVLAGDDDPLVPLANARFLAWRIPGARLHVVPGGGHLMLLDSPAETSAVIESFLRPDGGWAERAAS
jgi:pimeloyl-ACP methyl ester carboxylesterase